MNDGGTIMDLGQTGGIIAVVVALGNRGTGDGDFANLSGAKLGGIVPALNRIITDGYHPDRGRSDRQAHAGTAALVAQLANLGLQQQIAVGAADRQRLGRPVGCVDLCLGREHPQETLLYRGGHRRAGKRVAFQVIGEDTAVLTELAKEAKLRLAGIPGLVDPWTSSESGNMELYEKLLNVLSAPFNKRDGLADFEGPAPDGFGPYKTFCGT